MIIVCYLHPFLAYGCICQRIGSRRDGHELPVAFYSRQLRGAESCYSTTEMEALAVVSAVEHFLPYLFDTHFVVVTYHKALMSLSTSKTSNRRLALKLPRFDVDVVYREKKLCAEKEEEYQRTLRTELQMCGDSSQHIPKEQCEHEPLMQYHLHFYASP